MPVSIGDVVTATTKFYDPYVVPIVISAPINTEQVGPPLKRCEPKNILL